ncbi:hypothetical protein [Streptomyces griseus]|uniref:hypothetical protein n=1 Tax=Streptomyces griseus TaxID=1911 RepID=UPI0008408820|nr:hypothetical protein [Streptomyces griseus]
MRAIRVAPVALLGAAACALMTPAASAQVLTGGTATTFTPTVTPSSVAPGGRVTLGAVGCTGDATAFSGVFDTVTIPRGKSATATVDQGAKRGAVYQVTFRCGATTKTAALTITAITPTTSSTAAPRGVLGGLGGSIEPVGPAELAAGSALVTAAAAGTFFALRRRQTGRQH